MMDTLDPGNKHAERSAPSNQSVCATGRYNAIVRHHLSVDRSLFSAMKQKYASHPMTNSV